VSFVGHLLRRVRAGEQGLLWNSEAGKDAPASIELVSDAFDSGASIPHRHAGDGVGDNVSPPLAWRNIPHDTAELALVIEDADAPLPRPFVHTVVTAIPPEVTRLAEGALVEQPELAIIPRDPWSQVQGRLRRVYTRAAGRPPGKCAADFVFPGNIGPVNTRRVLIRTNSDPQEAEMRQVQFRLAHGFGPSIL
jgi:hypothetical protein